MVNRSLRYKLARRKQKHTASYSEEAKVGDKVRIWTDGDGREYKVEKIGEPEDGHVKVKLRSLDDGTSQTVGLHALERAEGDWPAAWNK